MFGEHGGQNRYFKCQSLASFVYREYWLDNLTVELRVPAQQRVTCDPRHRCAPSRLASDECTQAEPRENRDLIRLIKVPEGHKFHPVQSSFLGRVAEARLSCLLGH